MKPHLFALVDANNFYISCEQLFHQSLHHRPVVVLGNNDGCVVARSNEAKALGIGMGMPYFQCRELIERHQVCVYSSNYPLYQSLSDRIMKTLETFQLPLEVYSIDEAFLDLSSIAPADCLALGRHIREHVRRVTGIPVSVGIASSKTLAKLASETAKKQTEHEGVLSLAQASEQEINALLSQVPVDDLWGIGKQSVRLLAEGGMVTAKALKDAEPWWVRRHLTLRGERVVFELRGEVCYPLETRPKARKHILSSLSFGRPIESLQELEEAIACYASLAAEKLRRQHSLARQVGVFIHTNPFDDTAPSYANSATMHLPLATAYTPTIIQSAITAVHTIYRPGIRYKKAGVFLSEISSQYLLQPDLFDEFSFQRYEKQQRLMQVVDDLNYRMGRDTIFFGTQGMQRHRSWFMHQKRRSRRFMTRWDELLEVGL